MNYFKHKRSAFNKGNYSHCNALPGIPLYKENVSNLKRHRTQTFLSHNHTQNFKEINCQTVYEYCILRRLFYHFCRFLDKDKKSQMPVLIWNLSTVFTAADYEKQSFSESS